jgi:GH15 family glucan-1,4-alpha-glucosidase
VARAVRRTEHSLRLPGGGVLPGSGWPGNRTLAWTPETAFFALYDAATWQRLAAAAILSWLAAHRTRLGELPEQVNSRGRPASVAPLAWTDAIVLLALADQGHPLPVPGMGG